MLPTLLGCSDDGLKQSCRTYADCASDQVCVVEEPPPDEPEGAGGDGPSMSDEPGSVKLDLRSGGAGGVDDLTSAGADATGLAVAGAAPDAVGGGGGTPGEGGNPTESAAGFASSFGGNEPE